jgi:hypothetical protein
MKHLGRKRRNKVWKIIVPASEKGKYLEKFKAANYPIPAENITEAAREKNPIHIAAGGIVGIGLILGRYVFIRRIRKNKNPV